MALARWTGVVQDAEGNAVSGAQIEVRNEATGGLVPLYADRDGTIGLGNPFTASDATIFFHAEGGAYRVKAMLGGFEREWRYVSVGTAAELDAEALQEQIATGLASAVQVADAMWLSKAIGEFYFADDGVVGVEIPPQNPADGLGAWVELTAGLTGSGQFNNGKLTSESVSGSAPLVQATAVISVADSPMNGQTIRLLNTERRFLRAGAAGVVEQDAMQRITGGANTIWPSGTTSGAITQAAGAINSPAAGGGASRNLSFDSGNSPGARVSDQETRVKNIGVRIFRKVG